MNKVFFSTPFLKNARRGMPLSYPENTAVSFRAALDAGADVIETDARLTADGRVVLFHDESAARMGVNRRIADMTFDEISGLDAGYGFTPDGGKSFPYRGKGLRVMSIEECLRSFPCAKFNIDLKAGGVQMAERFCAAVYACGASDRILAASQDHETIRRARKKIPSMATAFSAREAFGIIILSRCGLLFLK